jgi:CBS domain-containing protein
MKVNEIMTKAVHKVSSTASCSEAARKMDSLNVGILPVEENGKLVGTVTDRDICIRAIARDKDCRSTTVKDIMTRNVITCLEDEDLAEAVRLMEERQIHRLVVCDQARRPIGMLSVSDIATKAHEDELAGEVLEAVCAP